MKFALFTHMPWPENTDASTIFGEMIEQAQYGEEIGFESIWLAEHHFSRYCLGSSSLVLASGITANTKNMRVGTAVLVPTLHNPIRLAEDAATVDCLSGGRLDLGFGRGTFGYEYGGFNVDQEESQARFQESVKIVEGLMTTTEFSFEGQYYNLDKLNLVPPPVQKPHPPIYIAASTTDETMDFAIDNGYMICAAVVQDTERALGRCKLYVEKSKEAGRNVAISDIPFFRYFYVAETEEQARKDTEAHINWILDIMQWRRDFKVSSEVPYSMENWRSARTEMPIGYDYIYENRAIIGTPEQCLAKIEALRAEGIDHFGCNFAFGGLDQRKVLRSMELFKDEIMPRLA